MVVDEKVIGLPSRIISPELCCATPERIFISVDLPAPFSPNKRRDLTPMDIEVDSFQSVNAAIRLRDIARGEHHFAFGRFCVRLLI